MFGLGLLMGCELFDAIFLAMFVGGMLFGVAVTIYFSRTTPRR